jgi:hypothetical protein
MFRLFYLNGDGIMPMVAIITSRIKMVMRPSITLLFSISPAFSPEGSTGIITRECRTGYSYLVLDMMCSHQALA